MSAVLAIAPAHNSPGKHDATGAFLPESLRWCKLHDGGRGNLFAFDNREPMWIRRHQIWNRPAGQLDTVAFFCHGTRGAIQAGWSLPNIDDLFHLLDGMRPRIVVLYCCDTGRDNDNDRKDDIKPGPGGDGGFADMLRDKFLAEDTGYCPTIYAHAIDGHATRNPYVRVFDDKTTHGGRWLIEPGSELWVPWRKALREPKNTLRLRFPTMLLEDIEAELRGRP